MDPRRYPSIVTAVTALLAQSCGLVTSSHEAAADHAQAAGSAGQGNGGTSPDGSGDVGGRSGQGGSRSGEGGTGNVLFLGGAAATEPCFGSDDPAANAELPFADQIVAQIGTQRVFYSWTTDEQVAELRTGTELFSRSERAGQGRGLLFTELAAYAKASMSPEATLADTLVNETFAKARFAWTNPWATLLGFPGESYGNQLLRIELTSDAWIARFDHYGLSVYDANGRPVSTETALASPERIGAIFYQSSAEAGNGFCGTFSQGGVGFREFALGNFAMVHSWSLATPEIAERLKSDIAELQDFEQRLSCVADTSNWSLGVGCNWEDGFYSNSVADNYDFSLALPSELYRPSAVNIEALIAALEASMPTGEPLSFVQPNLLK